MTPAPEREPPRPLDMLGKQALTAGLAGVLAQVGVTVDPASLAPRPVELPAGVRLADLVFAETVHGKVAGTVVQVEYQQRSDPTMGRRMADYAVRLAGTEGFAGMTDLVQVVVQVEGPPMPTRYRMGRLTNEFALLHVPTTPPDRLLSTPALAPFALVPGGQGIIREMVQRFAAVEDHALRSVLADLSIHLVPRWAHIIVEYLGRFGMTDIVDALRETDYGQDLIGQGRVEGRVEGQREERLASTVAVLAARFPTAAAAQLRLTAERLVAEHAEAAAGAAAIVKRLDE